MARHKEKRPKKRFLIAVIVIILIIGAGASGSNKENTQSESLPRKTDTKIQDSTNETDVDIPDKIKGSTKDITALLNSYNTIAEYPIASDMVRDGARDYDNWVSVNEVSVHIINTTKAMFVDYSWDGPDDSPIVPVMRDFCKALDSSVTDEVFSTALEALRSGEYKNYNKYTFSNIQAMYMETSLWNGNTSFLIKTEFVEPK